VAIFNVRLSDDLAARFDAAAAGEGGRSALLRRLIATAALHAPPGSKAIRQARPQKLTVRLSAQDQAGLAQAAEALGLTPNAWAAALIRRRLTHRPTFGPAGAASLAAIQAELRRIGVNVNQIARALNTGVMEGRVLELEIAQVAAFRAELAGHMAGLRAALRGNLEDWEAGG
jgi:hypothetical protein